MIALSLQMLDDSQIQQQLVRVSATFTSGKTSVKIDFHPAIQTQLAKQDKEQSNVDYHYSLNDTVSILLDSVRFAAIDVIRNCVRNNLITLEGFTMSLAPNYKTLIYVWPESD